MAISLLLMNSMRGKEAITAMHTRLSRIMKARAALSLEELLEPSVSESYEVTLRNCFDPFLVNFSRRGVKRET